MTPRIAVPVPTSFDPAYNRLCWPEYARAVSEHGGEAVEVPLSGSYRQVLDMVRRCHGVLLPGSPADVDPLRYGQVAVPECAAPDPAREVTDTLLLEVCYEEHLPLLGICFGAQMLNVWRGGTLVQDLSPIPVNHAAGRTVGAAHGLEVLEGTTLSSILYQGEGKARSGASPGSATSPSVLVNSSHHQAVGVPGDGLRITGRSPEDGVVEGLEAEADDHFVVGLQWHPERTLDSSAESRAIFRFFLETVRHGSRGAMLQHQQSVTRASEP